MGHVMTPTLVQSLSLRDVSIALPGRELIRHLSIDIAPGQIVTVMGASGSGKSSLLAWIGGFLQAPFVATGEVLVGARRLNDEPPHARRAGILFQDDLLFPHLSVAGNLLFGVPAAVRSRADRRALVDALLRTLLSQPQLLLLDEPFGKLDALLRADFRRFVFEHAQQLQLPTLMVTHDEADAQAAAGPVVVIE
jgi:putative thiamine transport system ATP-binding protein